MFEVAELGQKLDRMIFKQQAPLMRERLLDAQFRLKAADFSVVIIIAGVEGAGKGETVNLLLEWLDARGIASHALESPTQEESERPYFYRFWRQLPPKGNIGIFFGSWYTQPIVDYVFGRSSEPRFEYELKQIEDFERMLADENVLVIKFWLHISKKQQRRRLKELEADRKTAWRVTRQDWKFHKMYDEFVKICSRALRRTSTGFAPWNIIEASDRRFRHMTIAEHVCTAIEQRLTTSNSNPIQTEPVTATVGPNVINSLDLTLKLGDDEYKHQLENCQEKLGRLSRALNERDRAAVVVFEGSDAAGKGGCIRRIVQSLDARQYRVISIAAPTDEERARPYLWRFWRHLPRRGHFTVFDRSWYGRVLVERVEGLCAPTDWKRAYAEINAFEEQLTAAGIVLIKFWLAISPDEQERRFKQREATGYKRYKLTAEDLRNREKWPAYEAAASEMIARTSTELAPWTLVEAEDKRHARVKVLQTIGDEIERAVEGKPKQKQQAR